MSWFNEQYDVACDAHKHHKYRPHVDYFTYKKISKQLPEKIHKVKQLCNKFEQKKTSTLLDEKQLKALEDMKKKLKKSVNKWQQELDSALPGQLGQVITEFSNVKMYLKCFYCFNKYYF